MAEPPPHRWASAQSVAVRPRGSPVAGQAGCPVAEPGSPGRCPGPRPPSPAAAPVSLVGHALQRHVEAVLVVEAVPADGPRLAVGAHQELDVAHVAGEAHVLEGEHVAHQPVLPQQVPAAARRRRRLLPHGGQEELRETQRHSPTRRGRPRRAPPRPRGAPLPPAFPPPPSAPSLPPRVPVPHGGRRWRRRAAAPGTRSAGTAPPSGSGPARTPARPSPTRRRRRREGEREGAPPPAPSRRRPPPWPRRRAGCRRHRPRGGVRAVTIGAAAGAREAEEAERRWGSRVRAGAAAARVLWPALRQCRRAGSPGRRQLREQPPRCEAARSRWPLSSRRACGVGGDCGGCGGAPRLGPAVSRCGGRGGGLTEPPVPALRMGGQHKASASAA